MNGVRVCNICGVELVDENCFPSTLRHRVHRCKSCILKSLSKWRKDNPKKAGRQWERSDRKRGHLPMNKNRACSLFLGVCVAEEVLHRVFKDVKRMPHGNVGYDFVCAHDKRIDVKSSCTRTYNNHAPMWQFRIEKNKIADFFICIAFDNRHELNPLYMWLIPARDINNAVSISISTTTIYKWDKYELDIAKVASCCNAMKRSAVV